MKNIFTLTAISFAITIHAQDNILDARTNYSEGEVVTITGIVTNSSELNSSVRYVQDATAGIAIYPGSNWNAWDEPLRGDEVTITGTLSEFNGLIEVGPSLSSVTINSSGNVMPNPIAITPDQMNESYEGQLVIVNDVLFNGCMNTITAQTFQFTTLDSENGVAFFHSSSSLIGEQLPMGTLDLVGIISQYDPSFPYESGYQLLPRDMDDFVTENSINIVCGVNQGSVEYTTIELIWNTDTPGDSKIFWGDSPALGNMVEIPGSTTAHTATISGLDPGTIYWAQAASANGVDTAYSTIMPYATRSESSGAITVYFTKDVDVSYATEEEAIALYDAVDDTLIAYINRAQHSIDISMYNFGDTGIAGALNNAYNDGVTIRFVGQGTNANAAVGSLDNAIPVLMREDDSGSGNHNKFCIIDADYVDLAILITGSTNWIEQDQFSDYNNIIIFQDQSIARGYRLEFEEMWGSSGDQPDEDSSKFGSDKSVNTPWKYLCGSSPVEVYFSPTDNANQQIINTISTTDSELFYAMFAFTREDIADQIIDEDDLFLTTVRGVIEQTSDPSSVYQYLLDAGMDVYTHQGISGLIHHKYCIVDPNNTSSDPTVLTGSHNWSTSANTINDENTVVVHDARVANLYYQEFMARWLEVGVEETLVPGSGLEVWPNPADGFLFVGCGAEHQGAVLRIIDAVGNVVLEKTITSKTEMISLDQFSAGVYHCVLVSGEKVVTGKVVVR
ncbi:MAG: phospholipase D-like domain-containing protein [Flavobacteriales bacterium]|nr:phospholipase D-like domain-containing protein [Flavobacteriales bacterium]